MKRVVVSLGAAVAIASCALAGFEKGPAPFVAATVGGGGAGGEGGFGGAPGCEHATFPDPPAATSDGDETFVVAIHEIYFDRGAGTVGIDLDRRCTCIDVESGGCIAPGGGNFLPPDYVCDFDGGRDNGFAKVAETLKAFLNLDLEASYSAAANAGEWSIIVRVSGYNGTSNDDRVRVDWLQAAGFGATQPSWDGTDVWPVSATAYEVGDDGMPDPTQPKHFDQNAYVRDGLLVANLPVSPVVFTSGALSASQGYFELQISGGGLVARITGAAGARGLEDGVLAGMINEDAIFTAINTFRDDEGMAVCPDDQAYQLGLLMFCDARDSHDALVGPTTPCNSVSFGIGFSADPIELGDPMEGVTPAPSSCPMGGAAPETACPDDAMGGSGAGGSGGGLP